MSVNFTPVPSTVAYMQGSLFQNFIVGPLGSTKTTASIMKVLYEASQVAAGTDGIRRSRYAIVRNTRQQLFDSTIKDWLKWFPDGQAGSFLKTDMTFHLRVGNVHSEVMFRGLDDSNDVRRLLSLQLTGAFMDEFREINSEIFNALTGRLGRYPDAVIVPHRPSWGLDKKGNPIQGCVNDKGESMKRIWGSTNPPDMDTFWHKHLTEYDPATVQVSLQPGGLDQRADWVHLLPTDYYEDLMVGKTEDWIDVYVHGKWGKSLSGKPVFRSFVYDTHVAKDTLRPMRTETRPLIIGFDFGLNPSAVICQLDMFGRLMVLDAITSEGMGVLRFIQTKLRPTLTTARFQGLPIIVVGDPAGAQRAQTDERSCFDILKQEGFKVMPARTNSLIARIAAVDAYLMRQVEGVSGVIIDPCAKVLIGAMRGGYRYKIKKNGELEDAPEKNDYSHIADALQYACLHADGGLRGNAWGQQRRTVQPVNSRGWT